jgi:23S rRNA (adenine2030-N6)-methyltransferase
LAIFSDDHRLCTDYSHRYHAGNVGDVWKHCSLVSTLAALEMREGPLRYIETHAGEGHYALGATGEWTEGIGRIASAATLSIAAARYRERVSPHLARRSYPGSPRLALELLRPADNAIFYELVEATRLALCVTTGADTRGAIIDGDGLASLPACLEDNVKDAAELLVLVDPPYTSKEEWTLVPRTIIDAYRMAPKAHLLLWYPIKSLTRPEAMLRCLRASGVPATALELITTPLELKRNRLNGSGVLFVNPPAGVLEEVAAAAPSIGSLCATHDGRWALRGLSWK